MAKPFRVTETGAGNQAPALPGGQGQQVVQQRPTPQLTPPDQPDQSTSIAWPPAGPHNDANKPPMKVR